MFVALETEEKTRAHRRTLQRVLLPDVACPLRRARVANNSSRVKSTLRGGSAPSTHSVEDLSTRLQAQITPGGPRVRENGGGSSAERA